MLFGRFLMIVPIMALAGSLVQKKVAPPSVGTFPVSGGTFLILLLGTVLLIGALNFLPALTLGPIVEHFLTAGRKTFLGSRQSFMTQKPASLFDWNIVGPAIWRRVQKAEPASDGEEPGHVRDHGRRCPNDRRNFHGANRHCAGS